MERWGEGDLLGRADLGGTESRWYALGDDGYASFEGSALPGTKGGWQGPGDETGSLVPGWLPEPGPELVDEETGLPLAMDLLDLDAQSRRLNVALVDPETHRLREGWIHLPAYGRGGQSKHALEIAARGFGLPGRVPLHVEFRDFELKPEWCIDRPWPCENMAYQPDPIHSFAHCCARHILDHTEMLDFSVIDLRYIDVESTQAMVEYLAAGGFGIVSNYQLELLVVALMARFRERVTKVMVGLNHPLFKIYFDVPKYRAGNARCPPVAPLSGLALDGRLVAIAGVPRYIERYDCLANRLVINTYVFALTQPGPMNRAFLLPREPEPE